MTEGKALQGLKNGSQEALGWFIDQYTPYVTTIIYNVIGAAMSTADVEEVAADVFFALWSNARKVRCGSVKGYLGAIARNMAKNRLRRAGFQLQLEEDRITLDTENPEELYARKEAAAAVRREVEAMREPEREILLRFYYYYQSLETISLEMDINLSTVKTKLRRARLALKTSLERNLT